MHAKRFAQDPARRALICGTVTADINVQDSSKTHVVVTVFIILTTINNGCWSLEWGFFFPVWLRYIWPISLQKNHGIRHDDLTHIYCKTFTTVSLVNTSWLYIFSICCYYVRIFKVYSHGNFQPYNTVPSTIVTRLLTASPELAHLVTGSLYPFPPPVGLRRPLISSPILWACSFRCHI